MFKLLMEVKSFGSGTDSGYSTVAKPAEGQHVGLKDIVWEGSPGAEGGPDDQSQPVCASRPDSSVLVEAGEAECVGGPEAGARGVGTQPGGDGQRLDTESGGHGESEGGEMEKMRDGTQAGAGTADKGNDTDMQSSGRRRCNSNEYIRPELRRDNPEHKDKRKRKQLS
ncbi:hypothetical protein GJAV_G00222820 [Gymnothorax javanicus]|nr:hypothetical protein GJAV_G00222820 [Gymnothorax javanicus]